MGCVLWKGGGLRAHLCNSQVLEIPIRMKHQSYKGLEDTTSVEIADGEL